MLGLAKHYISTLLAKPSKSMESGYPVAFFWKWINFLNLIGKSTNEGGSANLTERNSVKKIITGKLCNILFDRDLNLINSKFYLNSLTQSTGRFQLMKIIETDESGPLGGKQNLFVQFDWRLKQCKLCKEGMPTVHYCSIQSVF